MLWALPLLPLAAAPLLYAWGPRSRGALTLVATGVVLLALALALVLSLAAAPGPEAVAYRWSPLIALRLEMSVAGGIFAVVVPLVAAPVIAYAGLHESGEGPGGSRPPARMLALMVAFVGAMLLLVLAADLLTLLIAWELVGACSWALIGHRWTDPRRGRDAGRAFLVTRAGDLGLYLGAAVLYAGTGSFAYGAIGTLSGPALELFAAGVLVAAAAKSAQLPFAPWLFAAMSGPAPVSALLHAATMVAAGTFLLARLYPQLSEVVWFAPAALVVGLATALAGGLVASVQEHGKKLLAASTSAHYGLMWVALGAGLPGVALIHFVAHACMKAPLFLAVGAQGDRAGGHALADLRAAPPRPGVAAAALVASLALAGVPPLGAAWSKEAVIAGASHAGPAPAALAMLAGALSAFYATRLQLGAFGLPGSWRARRGADSAAAPVLVLAVMTAALSLLWWPPAADVVGTALGMSLPSMEAGAVLKTTGLVLLAVGLGAWRVPSERRHAAGALRRGMADWLGLPVLAAVAIRRPLGAIVMVLAALEEKVAGARPAPLRPLVAVGGVLARLDDRVVDGGLRLTARLGAGLSRFGARWAEAAFDGLPGGAARGVGQGGRMARALHTGLAHHYYTLLAAGLAAMAALLALGGLR